MNICRGRCLSVASPSQDKWTAQTKHNISSLAVALWDPQSRFHSGHPQWQSVEVEMCRTETPPLGWKDACDHIVYPRITSRRESARCAFFQLSTLMDTHAHFGTRTGPKLFHPSLVSSDDPYPFPCHTDANNYTSHQHLVSSYRNFIH